MMDDEEEDGFFQRPVPKRLTVFGAFVGAYLFLKFGHYLAVTVWGMGPEPDNLALIYDVLMCGAGLVLWGVFFAQFVLPVDKLEGRIKIVERLMNYIGGTHGPAIFIENGIIHAREGETKKRGPGVLWLDSASAAMLRTAVKFTRTIGPGVHFTRNKEYIAATVDLHTLSQAIGPEEKDNPYITLDDSEKQKAVQDRCDETRALTRDNIEVIANISVTFRIKSKPGEGGSQLGYDEKNVAKAITESLLQDMKADSGPVWSTLPARMAADVWREYLRKFKLMQLFETPPPGGENALQVIGALIKKRLTQENVELWDDYGRPVPNEAAPSREFARLTEMGLEVSGVTIKRLIFQPDVENRLISQWTTQWLKNAQKERDQVEQNRKLTETRAQEEALKDFALQASQEISQIKLDEEAKQKVHALEMLVHSTFLGVRRNTALLKRANTEQRELSEIFRWLREKRGENTNDDN